MTNPQKSMNLKFDKHFRTTLDDDKKVEIHIFEPQNENYSWNIESWNDCKGQISLLKESVEPAFNRTHNSRVYTRMKDSYLIPGSSFSLTKDYISENVGVHKFFLKATNSKKIKDGHQC